MFDKYIKNKIRFAVDSLLFSSEIKKDTEKIFWVTSSLADAKYGLRNDQLYQIIRVINQRKRKKWEGI